MISTFARIREAGKKDDLEPLKIGAGVIVQQVPSGVMAMVDPAYDEACDNAWKSAFKDKEDEIEALSKKVELLEADLDHYKKDCLTLADQLESEMRTPKGVPVWWVYLAAAACSAAGYFVGRI